MEQSKAFRPSYISRSIQQTPLGRVVCNMDFVSCTVSIVMYELYGLLVTWTSLFVLNLGPRVGLCSSAILLYETGINIHQMHCTAVPCTEVCWDMRRHLKLQAPAVSQLWLNAFFLYKTKDFCEQKYILFNKKESSWKIWAKFENFSKVWCAQIYILGKKESS